MSDRPKYLIVAPRYNPDSGGAIFLHQLTHNLNELGERALIWPWRRSRNFLRGGAFVTGQNLLSSMGFKQPYVSPDLNTPLATHGDLQMDNITVYPEVVLGNPLGARKVVRWLLYPPGLKNPYKFTENEIFFRVGSICDLPEVTGGAADLYTWKLNPVYKNENRKVRQGACYLVRKGHEKPRIPETTDAIQIDGMSHEQIADIFNRCEVFYSYDEASFYSQFAAICGCVSVIVPGLFNSRQEWAAQHEIGRYGVAYGLDDLEHAKATAHLVEGLLKEKEAESLSTVKNFIEVTQSRFAGD